MLHISYNIKTKNIFYNRIRKIFLQKSPNNKQGVSYYQITVSIFLIILIYLIMNI